MKVSNLVPTKKEVAIGAAAGITAAVGAVALTRALSKPAAPVGEDDYETEPDDYSDPAGDAAAADGADSAHQTTDSTENLFAPGTPRFDTDTGTT